MNLHFAILSQTVVVLNFAAGGGERRSAGVRQLPATPTALSCDCEWQEGGAGATGGGGGRGGANGTEAVYQGLLTPQPPLGVSLLVRLAGEWSDGSECMACDSELESLHWMGFNHLLTD